MSDVILSGRLHPITPLRRSWVYISAFGWLLYNQRSSIQDLHAYVGYLWMAVIVAGAVGAVVGLMTLSWAKTSFEVTADHLDFQHGLLHRVDRKFPMDQIRTVDVERPLWARMLKVSSIGVYTQAESQTISYLSHKDAECIRNGVLRVIHGDTPSTEDQGVVARVSSRMLATSMVLDVGTALSLASGVAVAVTPYLVTEQVWSLALVIPWLRSAWNATGKRFPSDHGWTVQETESGFQTQSGLLNKSQYTWQKDRISSVTLHQPILWRSRDWVKVSAAIVGWEGATVIPVATRAQAEKLMTGLLGVESLKIMDDIRPVGRRARWCTPFWRACGYGNLGQFAAGWQGLFLRQEVTVVRMDRVVGVQVSQGWWQRRQKVASVHLLTPGGPDVEILHRDLSDAHEIFTRLSGQALTETQQAPRIRRIRISPDTRKRALHPEGNTT